jgi:hypothetical protein
VISAAARDAGRQIAAAGLARVAEPGTGRVRVEDYLTALGAITGEAAIVAAGIEIETLDIPPGSALFGDQVNQVLSGDTADLAAVPADSVVGILVTELVPKVYALADFGRLEDLYRGVAASVGQTEWGQVHLTVGDDHAPTVLPIRLAFELRSAVEAACSAAAVRVEQRHLPCAIALAGGLAQVREAIDPKVGLRLALEVVFGMAKMTPMSRRAFEDSAASPDRGQG